MTKRIDDVAYVLVRSFLPYIILAMIKKESSTTHKMGYLIEKQFGFRMSAGTIYGVVYGLERNGYIQKNVTTSTYTLTSKGDALLFQVQSTFKRVAQEIDSFLSQTN